MCRIHQKLGTINVIFPKNQEIYKILCTTNHKSNIIVVENSKKLGFSTNSKQIFTKHLLFYMWFYKGIKVNILATTQKTNVALISKINPVQITTIIAENMKIR